MRSARIASLALLVLSATAVAQERPVVPKIEQPGESGAPRDSISPAPPVELRLLVDRPLERRAYTLGPGDQVTITTSGEANLAWTTTVTPEGTLVIPTVGSVRVLDLDLDAAEEIVERRVHQYYRNVQVTLTLSALGGFKVFVVGDVDDPGPHVASSATRLSELVPPRRNVLVQRALGDTLLVDVVRFHQTGDLAYNPTVRAGDVIVVPQIDETVDVYGRVFFPDTYEYREGESLAELLRVANGDRGFPSDAHDMVYVSRFIDRKNLEIFQLARSEATGERGRSFALQPFDAVYVPRISDFKTQKTVTAEGEVRYPGVYPIRPDTTTVRDLVEMAGGFTEEASLVAAQLRRRPIGVSEQGFEELLAIPSEFLSADDQRILRVRQTADPGSVVIDFEQLFHRGEDAYNMTLRADDSLTVPKERRGVTVLGAVRNPGIVTYVSGRSIDAYVELAGDYTKRADRSDVVVLKARSVARLERREVREIESGDTIVVPYKEPRDWWEVFRTTSGITTGILSVVLAFIAATR